MVKVIGSAKIDENRRVYLSDDVVKRLDADNGDTVLFFDTGHDHDHVLRVTKTQRHVDSDDVPGDDRNFEVFHALLLLIFTAMAVMLGVIVFSPGTLAVDILAAFVGSWIIVLAGLVLIILDRRRS